MRTIDENKKERIIQSVYQIVSEEGLSALSFGKIAKRAKVSSGTPYVYYKDKTDMLSEIYVDIKNLMDIGLKEDINKGKDIEEKLFFSVYHFVEKFIEYPLEGNFMRSIQSSPELISEEAIKQGNFLSKPLFDLYDLAISKNALNTDNIEFINAILFNPVLGIIEHRQKSGQLIEEEELREVITISMNALLKSR